MVSSGESSAKPSQTLTLAAKAGFTIQEKKVFNTTTFPSTVRHSAKKMQKDKSHTLYRLSYPGRSDDLVHCVNWLLTMEDLTISWYI
jgi:hypothetical protein